MNDISEDLAEIYQQVIEKESNVYNKIYDEISYLEDLKLRYQHAAISEKERKNEEMDLSTEELNEKFEDLQEALIKQASFTNFTRDLLYNNEVEKAVLNHLDSLSISKDLESKKVILNILNDSSEALNYAVDISTATKERDEIQREVFNLNKKYIQLLHSIDDKWAILKGRKTVVNEDDVNLKNLYEKVERRESKLKVLVTLLSNMISANGKQWQEDCRDVQTLLCCDAFFAENKTEIEESIELLIESRKKGKERKRQQQITSYMQSTQEE